MSVDTAKLRLERWLEARAELPDSTVLNNYTFAELGLNLGDVREIADEIDRLRKLLRRSAHMLAPLTEERMDFSRTERAREAIHLLEEIDAAIAAQPNK